MADTTPDNRGIRIASAGNTGNRCLLAALAKGYRVWLDYHKLDKPILHWEDYQPWYWAERDGNSFIAHSPEELLGLIAMHEVRGNNWRELTDDEVAAFEKIYDSARTLDRDGNLLPDE